jgi:Chitobiase/beta-hexosaminidase C-terminal domain
MFDGYSGNTAGKSIFSYSSVQLYQTGQSPCNPNDSAPHYWGTNKISTSPVPLNSPSRLRNTTTGDTYSATISYDGTNLGLCLYDVTAANGSCSSGTSGTGTYFQQTWSAVNIPSLVNGNTAYVGIAESTGIAPPASLYIVAFSYTVNSAPSLPSLSTYTRHSHAGASAAATPTFSPAAGTYTGTQSVTISSSTSEANICYTLATPSSTLVLPWPDSRGGCQQGTAYTGPVSVSSSQTLYAVAGTAFTGLPSAQTSAAYTINSSSPVDSSSGGKGRGAEIH